MNILGEGRIIAHYLGRSYDRQIYFVVFCTGCVVRSVPPTQEYSSQRAIFSSSVPGHSSLPKYWRVASSWHASKPWQVFFTSSSCSLLLSSRMLQLYRTFSEKDNWSELNNHMNHKNFLATLRSIVPILGKPLLEMCCFHMGQFLQNGKNDQTLSKKNIFCCFTVTKRFDFFNFSQLFWRDFVL